MSREHRELSRREFLRRTTLGGAAMAGLAASAAGQTDNTLKIPRRKLGKTDLEVSLIGYGSEFMTDEALVEHLVAEGVNHIDTAVLYQEGNSERQLAPVLAKHKDVIIATKFHRAIPVDAPKEQFLEDFNGSCERMQVDGVDIIYLHDRRTPAAVDCRGAKEAFDELKAAGRVKCLGMSTHVGQAACIPKAVELGWFDCLLVAHNFMSPQTDADALKSAAEAGLGIMIIKVCKALSPGRDWYPRATDAQKAVLGEANLFQAAIKWALQREYVTAGVVCISNYDEAAEDVEAARGALSESEAKALGMYRGLASASVCRGCGSCEAVCPRRVAISDILRYGTYCEGYRQPEAAMAKYRALAEASTVAACNACGECEQACPYGLAIRTELVRAHHLLA